ncbi:NUDIX hydrolase [Andreprevotia chitinilytica]|uniref:NUDIX hydrolase n=1 Tax=Andreprevotia chitinilytica TaxID=396808 RepID=UPI00054EDD95|nr:NUDIX domain-containing protein [Andreprevotia chitinilytica]
MSTTHQDEREFLSHYNIHDYDVPLTSVDLVIFTVREEVLQVLLVRRGEHPFKEMWSLPGGFIDIHRDQDLEATALRKLREKTGVVTPYLEQLQGFGNKTRDPRGWSSTFAYFALIPSEHIELAHGANTEAAQWFRVEENSVQPELAFDHAQILAIAILRLRNKVEYTSLPVHLLPEQFTLSELQGIHEVVLGRTVDKSAFRKRIKEGNFVEEIPDAWRYGSNRPAKLYRRANQPTVYFNRAMGGRVEEKD